MRKFSCLAMIWTFFSLGVASAEPTQTIVSAVYSFSKGEIQKASSNAFSDLSAQCPGVPQNIVTQVSGEKLRMVAQCSLLQSVNAPQADQDITPPHEPPTDPQADITGFGGYRWPYE